MELDSAALVGGRIAGALHAPRHDDATADIYSRRILTNQQQQLTTLIRNTKETVIGQTAPDLVEDWSINSQSEDDDQISDSASYQTNEIKECDNMNSLKDYEIHLNNMPETMSAQESSSNMTDMETVSTPNVVEDRRCISSQSEDGQISNSASSYQTNEIKECDNMNSLKDYEIHSNNMPETMSAQESSSNMTDMETVSTPNVVEDRRCNSSQSEDGQISNSASSYQTNEIKECDNMNYFKDYEIHSNNMPETMSAQDSSSNMTMVLSKKGLGGTAPLEIQEAKLHRDSTNSHSIGRRSPMNWFPRRRTESYLERKIRMLQEVEGTNATLDETLGGSYPHLSRIEREKLAAQAAAGAAMGARKAALVEAAWCRILKAARIPCELAEVQLQNAEKKAAEAFEAAAALGVAMHIKPGGPKQLLEVETLAANGSQTHTVSASFETAFEVDKEVAGAVKAAFSNLVHFPSSAITDIFTVNDDACRKVSVKPDENDTALDNDFDGLSFESEAQTEGEQKTDSNLKNNTDATVPHTQRKHKKLPQCKKERANEVGISEELIDLMLERVKLLKEEELVSLAMIVATRGLSAMLKEENKEQELNGECNSGSLGEILVKHVSRLEAEKAAAAAAASKVVVLRDPKKKTTPEILPDLGSILVKHVSKLEREVQEARKLAKAMQSEDHRNSGVFQEHVESFLGDSRELGRLFVQHASNSEREVPVATEFIESLQREQRSMCGSERENLTMEGENATKLYEAKAGLSIKPSTETNMNLFEDVDNDYGKENRHVNTASTKINTYATNKANPENKNNLKSRQKSNFASTLHVSDPGTKHAMKNASEDVQGAQKKQHHCNENHEEGLDKLLVEHVSRLEKEKMTALTTERESSQMVQRNQYWCESFDNILVKHVSELEKVKMAAEQEGLHKILKFQRQDNAKFEEGLDKILIKHVSKLEREKQEASPEAFQRVQRKHAHHDENNWGSLDRVLVKHISRLEKEKQEASPEVFQRVQSKQHHHDENSWESLEKVLVKHLSTLEKEKLKASGKGASQEYEMLSSISSFSQDAAGNNSILKRHKNARDQEIQHAWGGMSLGNSLRPHLSKLELDKAAWRQAEEEELKRASQ